MKSKGLSGKDRNVHRATSVDLKMKKKIEYSNLNKYFSVFNIIMITLLTAVLSFMIIWNHQNKLIEFSVSTTEVLARQLNQRIFSDSIFAEVENRQPKI